MAIIYSYPLTTSPLNGSDLMLISDMTSSDRPTRSVTLQQIANFASAGGVAGVGQVIAGNNITLDPPEGTGIVTLNAVVPAPVTYTFVNASAVQTGDAILRLSDGTTDQNVGIKAGSNITIDNNASNQFTINADIACWTLSAQSEEGNVSLLLSDGGSEDPEGCPDTAVTFAAGENMTITSNEGGSIITFTATGGGGEGMASWTLSADSGTDQTVTNADTVNIAGGNIITTSVAATDEVTVTHDNVARTNTAQQATLAFGSSFSTITGITSSTEGHITNVTTSTLTIPSIPCASSTIGGIRASAVETTLPSPSETGNYYPIEVIENEEPTDNDCFAVVRVPTGGGAAISCPTATTLGGIRATQVAVTSPEIAGSGTYYPIETLIEQEVETDNCRAVVKIPDAAAPGNGQITITAGTGLSGGGTFTVNQAGSTEVTLNADSSSSETGWSPMTITEGATTLPVQAEQSLTIFYHATADATFNANTIKMMLTDVDAAGGVNKDDNFSVALYSGSLTDFENGGTAPSLINNWDYTPAGGTPVFGIKEITSETTSSIVAGNDYVIAVSVKPGGALLLGDGVVTGSLGSSFINSRYLGVGNTTLYGTIGDEWPENLAELPTFDGGTPWRYSIHFYNVTAVEEEAPDPKGG